jgi:prolyl-tRNA synthetase
MLIMISLSSYPFKTQKTIPTVSENRSTGLLLQAGFIRQELAGAYHFLHF